jgi:predicted esterase
MAAKAFLDDLVYRFSPSVFAGEQFPQGSFEADNFVNHAFGKPMVTTTFYNAQFQPVASAATDGRYGAVVKATFADGSTLTRFVTLYRGPKRLFWPLAHLKASMTFPPEWGVDPAVAAAHPEATSEMMTYILQESQRHNSGLAIMLAGLSEMKADGGPDVSRTGALARDEAWWWELKKRTGLAEPYAHQVYLPDGYDADTTKKWPLILFLHGSGERGSKLEVVSHTGLPQLIAQGQKYPAIIISPQCPANEWWNPAELSSLIDDVCAKYRVDTDRICVTGLSMGGFGAWSLALSEPERFAAIAPICGGGDTADAARLAKLPVWAFHGAKDDVVSPDMSREMVKAITAAGGKPHLTIFPNDGHFCWMDAYKMPELYTWLLAQKRGTPEASADIPK